MKTIDIPVVLADENLEPVYASSHAAGADLKANIESPVEISPGSSALIPTGIRVEIPEGYEIQIRPRSGLALKNQITVLNTPGTIDADYRGEIGVILINHGKIPFSVTRGMRIAQMVVCPVYQANFLMAAALSATQRGDNGFGHTGIQNKSKTP